MCLRPVRMWTISWSTLAFARAHHCVRGCSALPTGISTISGVRPRPRKLSHRAPSAVLQSWHKGTNFNGMNPMRVEAFLTTSAERFPDKVAVVADDRRITYRALDEMADRLAYGLLQN